MIELLSNERSKFGRLVWRAKIGFFDGAPLAWLILIQSRDQEAILATSPVFSTQLSFAYHI
jgi:hypothetical protein